MEQIIRPHFNQFEEKYETNFKDLLQYEIKWAIFLQTFKILWCRWLCVVLHAYISKIHIKLKPCMQKWIFALVVLNKKIALFYTPLNRSENFMFVFWLKQTQLSKYNWPIQISHNVGAPIFLSHLFCQVTSFSLNKVNHETNEKIYSITRAL